MNNIYVDELPKDCSECKLGYFFDTQYCFIRPDLSREGVELEKEKHCPLKPLTDRLAEERKKVIEKIKKQSVKHPTITIYAQGKEFGSEYSIDETILDQIERGDDTNVDTKNN